MANKSYILGLLLCILASDSLGGTPGTLRWRYGPLGSGISGACALGSDGTVYAGSADGYLYAVNPNGTLKWRYGNIWDIWGAPAIASDGTVYTGSLESYLYALAPSGKLKWQYPTDDMIYASPVVGPDGTIYVGSDANYFYALQPNGTLKWRYWSDGYGWTDAAIGADGTVYVGSDDSYLYAFDPNGTLKWRYPASPRLGAAFGADGTIYVGSADYHVYALRPNGTLKWRYQTGYYVSTHPAVGPDGTIYVGSMDDYVYALNPNGTLKWRYCTGGDVWAGPAIASDGTIYTGSWDCYVYALKPDGTLKWRYQTGNGVWTPPAIGPDGTVYVGSIDRHIYAIWGSAPLASSPWPKFHHDNRNTGWVGGPKTRVVRVKNNGNPVAGCSVYVNDVPQSQLTDSRGEIRIANLKQNDEVWAKKKVYTEPAVKPGHEAVGNAMYVLWMDTKTLLKSGSTWDWQPHKVSGTTGDIDLDLAHPLFKWNLVVSLQWNAPADEWPLIRQTLSEAADWFYNVSDGQMTLGNVAVYDAKQRWFPAADYRIEAETWLRAFTGWPIATYSKLLRMWIGGGVRFPLSWPCRVELGSADVLYDERVCIHELGHYALGLYDEYEDGNGNEDFPYRKGVFASLCG